MFDRLHAALNGSPHAEDPFAPSCRIDDLPPLAPSDGAAAPVPPSAEPAPSAAALGDSARDAGQWHQAVIHYQAHVATHPHDFAILVQLGNCAKECGDFLGAHAAYVEALALSAADADLHLQMGHLFKKMGRRRDALRAYATAARLDPASAHAPRELAALHSGTADDIVLPLNSLDFLTASSVPELLAKAAEAHRFPDPFTAYRDLIDG